MCRRGKEEREVRDSVGREVGRIRVREGAGECSTLLCFIYISDTPLHRVGAQSHRGTETREKRMHGGLCSQLCGN